MHNLSRGKFFVQQRLEVPSFKRLLFFTSWSNVLSTFLCCSLSILKQGLLSGCPSPFSLDEREHLCTLPFSPDTPVTQILLLMTSPLSFLQSHESSLSPGAGRAPGSLLSPTSFGSRHYLHDHRFTLFLVIPKEF